MTILEQEPGDRPPASKPPATPLAAPPDTAPLDTAPPFLADLASSRRFAEQLGDWLPGLIYIFDLHEQRNLYINRAALTLLGYTPEQVQGYGDRMIAELIHPDDAAAWAADILPRYATATDETLIENELRLRHADGQWRWFLVHERIWRRHPDGRPAQVIAVGQDVTARHDLVGSQLNMLLANAYDGLALIDPTNRLFYASPSLERILGLPIEQIVGQNLGGLVHPDDMAAAQEAFAGLIAQPGSSLLLPLRIRHAEGSWRWLETAGANLLNHPDVGAIVAILRDVTDRIQAEAQLRYQARLVEHSFNAIIATDLEYRVRSWNPAAERIYGWTAQEIVGRPLNEYLATVFVSSNRAAALDDVQATGRWQGEVWQTRKDGSTVEIESSVVLLYDETGAVVGLVATNHDITERKAAERALVAERALLAEHVEARTAELRAANLELADALRVKDEFLAAVSHELRTPMQAILGLAENMANGLAGPLTERQARYVGLMLESGEHLLALINDILAFARSQRGQTVIEPVPVAVPQLCDRAVQLIRGPAARKRQAVEVELDGGCRMLSADPGVVKQILIHLLTNAVKFTPEGGAVGLLVRGDVAERVVHFTVWDNGIGIAPQDFERVFRPFTQLDSGLDRQYGGTGLGLALCQRLARLHGGWITLTSTPGVGSRFTLTLPWAEAGLDHQP